LSKQNAQLNAQLLYMKKHSTKGDSDKSDVPIEKYEVQLEAEEKELSPSELILHRFAATEVNDIRLTPDERMKKNMHNDGRFINRYQFINGTMVTKK